MEDRMAKFQPRQILGKWREGFALDIHTVSSTPVGYNEYGHMQFDTVRSEIGELLYKLKNKADQSVVPEIVAAAVEALTPSLSKIDVIAPVPPSTHRAVQPVRLLADAISKNLNIPVVNAVQKIKETPQLNNVYDLDERTKILDGAFKIDPSLAGKRVLLFDDLYRSGATMNAITVALLDDGKAADVMALTITRTRSNQ
jgi:predicted amidophosphoribosyltransferase